MKYIISVIETYSTDVAVEADSIEEARQLVQQEYENGYMDVNKYENYLESEYDTVVEPTEKLSGNTATLLLNNDRVLLLHEKFAKYDCTLISKASGKQIGDCIEITIIKDMEEALPCIFKIMNLKMEDILSKYDGNVVYELIYTKEI